MGFGLLALETCSARREPVTVPREAPANSEPGGQAARVRRLGRGDPEIVRSRRNRGFVQGLGAARGPGARTRRRWAGSLHEADPGLHEVLAGPDRRAQDDGRWTVGLERPEPVPVGPQDVGEQVCIGAVVLVARRPVPGAQRLHVAAGDDEHREPRGDQGVDDRAVGPLATPVTPVLTNCRPRARKPGPVCSTSNRSSVPRARR